MRAMFEAAPGMPADRMDDVMLSAAAVINARASGAPSPLRRGLSYLPDISNLAPPWSVIIAYDAWRDDTVCEGRGLVGRYLSPASDCGVGAIRFLYKKHVRRTRTWIVVGGPADEITTEMIAAAAFEPERFVIENEAAEEQAVKEALGPKKLKTHARDVGATEAIAPEGVDEEPRDDVTRDVDDDDDVKTAEPPPATDEQALGERSDVSLDETLEAPEKPRERPLKVNPKTGGRTARPATIEEAVRAKDGADAAPTPRARGPPKKYKPPAAEKRRTKGSSRGPTVECGARPRSRRCSSHRADTGSSRRGSRR